MFIQLLHFHCLLVAISPATWRDLHMLSATARRILRYCEMHPPIPPIVQTSVSLSHIGFTGGLPLCEALRTTCRRCFWQIERLYAWYSWTALDLHDRIQHYHQFPGLLVSLAAFSQRFVDVFLDLSASPIRCNPHLVETFERTAQILGFPPRHRGTYLGISPPQYMLHR